MVMIIIIMVVITIITLIYAARGDIDDDMNCKKGTDNDGIISDDDDNDGIKDNDDDNDDDNASSPERSIKLAHVPPWIPCMMMIMWVMMMKRDWTPMMAMVMILVMMLMMMGEIDQACARATLVPLHDDDHVCRDDEEGLDSDDVCSCVYAQRAFVVVFARTVAENRSEYAILKQRAAVIGVVVMETHCRCNSGESTSNSNKSGLEVKFK